MKTFLDDSPYAQRLGVEIESLDGESARMRLPFKAENSNPGDVLHGGVAASMINMGALAVAEVSLGEDARRIHTASIQITYLAAAIAEPIIADTRLLRRGKEICFLEVNITSGSGKPISRGVCTVRGRFGETESEPVIAIGDDGQANPGPMGPALPARVPFIGRLGLNVQHMADGRSRINMPFIDINADATGGVHEGAILAHLDTTGAMAAWAETGPGNFKASTVGVHAQMVDWVEGEELIAYGRVEQRDREIFWTQVEVATASTNRTVARGQVLYRIVIPQN